MQGKLGICNSRECVRPYLKPFHLVQKLTQKTHQRPKLTAETIKFLEVNKGKSSQH